MKRKGEGMIYLDAVWLLNVLMDGMILYLTQGLTRTKTSVKRIFFGAVFASMIVPVTVYMPHSWLVSSPGKALFSCFIILVAFSFVSVRTWLKQLASFYFVTFSIGGCMLGIHYFLSSEASFDGSTFITHNGGYGDPVSWLFVLAGFPFAWWFTKWRMEQANLHRMKLEDLYDVEITWRDRTYTCRGMVDSGNQLVDPMSRKIVFLADQAVFNQFLTNDELEMLKVDEVMTHMDQLSEDLQSSLRLVPYQAAGTEGKLLVTLLIDRLAVKTPGGSLEIKQPLLGIQHHDLSRDGSYHLLIHPHLMVRGKTA
ncbi:sigma-E processing peptidase SpoIIGA [Halobacillus salinarum]|uniref:Sigma-E processing peptidase SpoIIGA n=1 Tax=Halobacillus salinarum TaxID=2932257 RepID=A0ABY4EGW8_9BACI|nr:sigma-E processing peptidase SpoIIGA [Halobacillus salinarum]UOQ43128.1 sigma-E processing peptidase SpoIIGA [Halobacillus salinarum]